MTLTEWRERESLSMTEVGKRLGMSQSTISRIEAGIQLPADREAYEAIFRLTDGAVTPNDFVPVTAGASA